MKTPDLSQIKWLKIYFPAVIILLAAILRYFFIFEWHQPGQYLFSDMATYLKWANQILSGQITQDHFFQPIGLPALEALLLSMSPDGLQFLSWLQWVASLLTLVLIWRTTLNLLNYQLALIALILASFHYPFIFISGIFLSECLFTFVLSLIIWLLSTKQYPWPKTWSYLLGTLVGFSLWLKGTFALFLPLLWLWTIYKCYKYRADQNLLRLYSIPTLLFSLGLISVMILHGTISYHTINEFHLSPTNGGLNFVEGKCPWKKNIAPDGQWWQSPLFAQTQEHEQKKWDQPFHNSSYFYQQGLECIIDNPVILIDSLRYIPYLFINNEFWPSLNTAKEYKSLSRNYNLFFAFWALPALAFALLTILATPNDQKWLTWLLPVITIFCTVWMFKSEVRFRIPFDVVFIPLCLWGWDLILSKIFTNWSEHKRYLINLGVSLFVAISVTYSLLINATI